MVSSGLRKVRVQLTSGKDQSHIKWASTRENLSSGVCEKHRRRPACASAQPDQRLCLSLIESIIYRLATSAISNFYLVSVAEETGLKLALSENPKTGFLASRPI